MIANVLIIRLQLFHSDRFSTLIEFESWYGQDVFSILQPPLNIVRVYFILTPEQLNYLVFHFFLNLLSWLNILPYVKSVFLDLILITTLDRSLHWIFKIGSHLAFRAKCTFVWGVVSNGRVHVKTTWKSHVQSSNLGLLLGISVIHSTSHFIIILKLLCQALSLE